MGLTNRQRLAVALLAAALGTGGRAFANYGAVLPAPVDASPAQTEPPVAHTPEPTQRPAAPRPAAAQQAADDEDAEGDDEALSAFLPPPPAGPRTPPVRRVYAGGPRHISGHMLGLRFGFAGGGTTLVRARLSDGSERTITAGSGGQVALAGAMTPYWTETFGVGLGVEFGWKGQEIAATNATISMRRFPLVATAHILAQVAEHSYVLIQAGVQHDFGIAFASSGIAGPDYTLESGLGILAGLGYHHALGQNFTLDGQLRFVKLNYEAQMGAATGQFDARHFAFLLGANYQFDSTIAP